MGDCFSFVGRHAPFALFVRHLAADDLAETDLPPAAQIYTRIVWHVYRRRGLPTGFGFCSDTRLSLAVAKPGKTWENDENRDLGRYQMGRSCCHRRGPQA
jgi:hypothetical protein